MRRTPLLLGTLILAACSEQTTEPQAGPTAPKTVASVQVTPNTRTLTAIGAIQQFQATARDADGATLSGKSFTWASSSPAVATVSSTGLATAATDGSTTITATTDGVSGSASLTVVQTAAQLAFTGQPTDAVTGEAITPAVEVTIKDALGNTVTGATDAVTLAIGTNPGGGTLSGTTTVSAVAGVVSFSGLSIDKVGSGYTLIASSGTLTAAASALFNITAPAPASLAFTTAPSNTVWTRPITPAVVVAIEDAVGNPAQGSVTVALGSNPGGAILSGTLTVEAVNGVATFNDLSIPKAGSPYTLVATSGALSTTSTAFAIFEEFAYVTNPPSGTVHVIETANHTVVTTISVGNTPEGIAVRPDGAFVYVANRNSGNVSVVATATNTVVATVGLGGLPVAIALTPNGAFAYVNRKTTNAVSVIATATNTEVTTVPVGVDPLGIAISPNGAFAYVTNFGGNSVSVISTATNTVVATISVNLAPFGVAITPDGAFLYVVNKDADIVSVIATATNTVIASIAVGGSPQGVAITPDGAFAYVTNGTSNSVSVIDVGSNILVNTIFVGIAPFGVAITQDGTHAYVANVASGRVSVIEIASNTVVKNIFGLGTVVGVALTAIR